MLLACVLLMSFLQWVEQWPPGWCLGTSDSWHVDEAGVEFGPAVPREGEQVHLLLGRSHRQPAQLPWLLLLLGCARSAPKHRVPQKSASLTLLCCSDIFLSGIPGAQQPCTEPTITPSVCLCSFFCFLLAAQLLGCFELLNLGVKREKEELERRLIW